MEPLILHVREEPSPGSVPLPAVRRAAPLLALGLPLLLLALPSLRRGDAVAFRRVVEVAGRLTAAPVRPALAPALSQAGRPIALLPRSAPSAASAASASRAMAASPPATVGRPRWPESWAPWLSPALLVGAAVAVLRALRRHAPWASPAPRPVAMATTMAEAEEAEDDTYNLKFMTLEGDGMPCIIDKGRVPIKAYTKEIEPDCYQQLLDLANSPVPVGHVSCMPDVHLGKGATVGSVFASEQYVAPMAVGVDIGCGMIAVPVDGLFQDDAKLSFDNLVALQKAIKKRIPTGNGPDGNRSKPVDHWLETMERITAEHPPSKYLKKAMLQEVVGKQLGTLGGGNHFIEMLRNEQDGQVWLMVHSGSRRIGNETATYYDRIAKAQMKAKNRKVYGQLHYLDTDSKEGQAYLQDMSWCQGYALYNRQTMLHTLADVVQEFTGRPADMGRMINVHHNYCVCEQCTFFNCSTQQTETKKLWITRKGATSAKAGEYGIIPGSMGVGSYIVRGRGNPDSWQSCSHGAGRKMSRTKAKNIIKQSRFEQTLEGVVCDRNPSLRDEAPDAYKDLTTVMQNQESLIEVVHRLLPVVNVKGF